MKGKISVNRDFVIDTINENIYGSFLEHVGRAIYSGIYEPGHTESDDMGFRKDVMELVREINVPAVRYPGGNFVSGYNWEDGIGPAAGRPVCRDLAWKALEPNKIGVNEFSEWARRVNTEVMMAVNLGTKGPDDARNLLEYCNFPEGTKWSELRRKHGYMDPHNIKLWCLGNEMDGVWQMCHSTADEYGRKAAETAKLMKWSDPSIELIVCGSSGPQEATLGEWDMTVLNHTYDFVDYISLHMYLWNRSRNTADFLAESLRMDSYIKTIGGLCDYIKLKKGKTKNIKLSFDEWGISYHTLEEARKTPHWQTAPRRNEDIYTMEDVLATGCMLNTLINNSDRVKIACQAQLINVVAPIIAEPGGKAWRQSIFWPYKLTRKYGIGKTLKSAVNCGYYDTADFKKVPWIDTAVVYNEKSDNIIFFVVNRNTENAIDLELSPGGFANCEFIEHQVLHHPDLQAVNSCNEEKIKPENLPFTGKLKGNPEISIPPASWNMIRLKAEPA